MRLCLAIPEIDTGLVRDVCTSLANYNARTYRCRPGEPCTRSPWTLRYDATAGDSRSLSGEPTLTMRDAVTLLRVGSGACGELSAAYVGWLRAHGREADIVVIETGPDTWHVVARVDGHTIDPARPAALHEWRTTHGMR
jgi:hypothetical protein